MSLFSIGMSLYQYWDIPYSPWDVPLSVPGCPSVMIGTSLFLCSSTATPTVWTYACSIHFPPHTNFGVYITRCDTLSLSLFASSYLILVVITLILTFVLLVVL